MNPVNIIRKTRSLCPACLKYIDAYILEKDKKIWLTKSCLDHGDFEIVLSGTPEYYKKLDMFYFTVMKGNNKLREYELWPTLRCNMNCTICCFGENLNQVRNFEATCSEINNFVRNSKANFYILSGGEPTCHEDLDKIIRIMKDHKKTVTINTNGCKLVDGSYLNALKNSGLDRVNLQFDGFQRDVYFKLRGGDFLDIKLKAINNLKSINMPTVFNATIARNVNEEAIGSLVNYAARNPFVNAINFFTICSIGGGKNWPLSDYIMPDEVIDILEKQSDGKISKENVFLFNKLHFAVKSLFSQRYCFYNYIYLLVRESGSYKPIDKFINIRKIDLALDNYSKFYKKSVIFAKAYLVLTLLRTILLHCPIGIIKDFILINFSYFFKTAGYLKTKKFFYISFSTGCDPYKADYSIIRNCQNEIIAKDSNGGKLDYRGREGLYCLSVEKSRALKDRKSTVPA